jgi:hypothetical protein
MAYTELGSQRQLEKTSTDKGITWIPLTSEERKNLKRSQFAFGSLYPFIFDGLATAATRYGIDYFSSHEEYYRIELPINELFELSLADFDTSENKQHLVNELLKQGSTFDKEEVKHLRCVPMNRGEYISIQPLIIGFKTKTQDEIPLAEIKKLINLKTYSKHTKVINTVIIFILQPLLNPIFPGKDKGWFHCPTALQAKIKHTLQELTPKRTVEATPDHIKSIDEKFHKIRCYELEGHFLRKYYLYLNTQDGTHNTNNYFTVDAIDLWEHVSPSEIIVNRGYKYLRDWGKAREKLEAANEFYKAMETRGLMEGAKAFPTTQPKGVYYHKDKQTYRIYYKRSPEFTRKRKELCTDLV